MAALAVPSSQVRSYCPFPLHFSTRCSKLQTLTAFPPPQKNNPFQKSSMKSVSLPNRFSKDDALGNKIIKELTDQGSFADAIKVFLGMLEQGLPLVEFRFFPLLLKAFGGVGDVEKGRQIFGYILKLGFAADIQVCNSLLSMFFKCGAVEDALQLFEKFPDRDSISWNAMVTGFCKSGRFMDSLAVFGSLVREFGKSPGRVSFVSALSSCASLQSVIHGREIHCFVLKSGMNVDEQVINALIEMYMKCGDPKKAELVFQSHFGSELTSGNTVIWNVMILGYVSNSCYSQALEMFINMLMLGMRPDTSTMVAILVLCSQSEDSCFGKQIHSFILTSGLDNDVRVQTTLMDMYFKCGDAAEGLRVFEMFQTRNLVMWGAIISNCAQSDFPEKALKYFHIFRSVGGFTSCVILLAVLRACSSLNLEDEGMAVHCLVLKMGFHSDDFLCGALVDMYAKCRDMDSAQKAFCLLQRRDLISWNALISGYAQNERGDEALRAFRDMQSEKIRPNAVTAACLLSVAASLSGINLCKEAHGCVIRLGIELNVLVSNSLIAAYSKCGGVNVSRTIFERMNERNIVSWNSIIHGFGMHGRIDEVFALFEKMRASSMKPDRLTFTAILTACSHAGRVVAGWKYFRSMVEDYKLEPQLEQYTCMVDLLGRAGYLNQAHDLIKAMPYAPDARIWGSLLGSCKSHGNNRLAEVVANKIFELDPTSIGYHVLLSNIYEDFEKWNELSEVRSKLKDMGLKKQPGCSWIEINNKTHVFSANDKSHHFYIEIYKNLENLTIEILQEGYPLHNHTLYEFDVL